jgi:hypothetical protein
VSTTTRISESSRADVSLTLSLGYRVLTTVQSRAWADLYVIRILDKAGVSMDDFLDVASNRGAEPGARLSLGPLPPGSYVLELQGPREHLQQPFRIIDRDVRLILP